MIGLLELRLKILLSKKFTRLLSGFLNMKNIIPLLDNILTLTVFHLAKFLVNF